MQVKRTILPEDDDDDDDDGDVSARAGGADEGHAPRRRTKIKIRKGGTVSGGKLTTFDDYGEPI